MSDADTVVIQDTELEERVALARYEAPRPAAMQAWIPRFQVSLDEAKELVRMRRQFLSDVMIEGVHYGTIPGAGDKKCLLKPGAQFLLSTMGLNPEFIVTERVFDLIGGGGEPFINYEITCRIYRQTGPARDDRAFVAEGIGSCNSWESKYRYRQAQRKCPECGAGAIGRSKFPPRGSAPGTPCGWWCNPKGGGCGKDFPDGYRPIEDQAVGRIPNPDIADQANTIKKMAAKRAMVDATINATGCADIFTQDLEEKIGVDAEDGWPVHDGEDGYGHPQTTTAAPPPQQQRQGVAGPGQWHNDNEQRTAQQAPPQQASVAAAANAPSPFTQQQPPAQQQQVDQVPANAQPVVQSAQMQLVGAVCALARHVSKDGEAAKASDWTRTAMLTPSVDKEELIARLKGLCLKNHGDDCQEIGQLLYSVRLAQDAIQGPAAA